MCCYLGKDHLWQHVQSKMYIFQSLDQSPFTSSNGDTCYIMETLLNPWTNNNSLSNSQQISAFLITLLPQSSLGINAFFIRNPLTKYCITINNVNQSYVHSCPRINTNNPTLNQLWATLSTASLPLSISNLNQWVNIGGTDICLGLATSSFNNYPQWSHVYRLENSIESTKIDWAHLVYINMQDQNCRRNLNQACK